MTHKDTELDAQELRDILSKVLLDGQNQINDLVDGEATPEEVTERVFASLDYWQPKAEALIAQREQEAFRAGITQHGNVPEETIRRAYGKYQATKPEKEEV